MAIAWKEGESTFKRIEAERNKVTKTEGFSILATGNIFYEELKCLGFYPQERRLEAVIEIKRPSGYGGNALGSYEYVGFYVNWNNDPDFIDTGDSVGVVYTHIFDPGSANIRKLPICYSVYRDIIPVPTLPVGTVVRARAILSWQTPPTGPNFKPVWGNVIESWIRIEPIQ